MYYIAFARYDEVVTTPTEVSGDSGRLCYLTDSADDASRYYDKLDSGEPVVEGDCTFWTTVRRGFVDGPFEADDLHLLDIIRAADFTDAPPHLFEMAGELMQESRLHPKMLQWERQNRDAPDCLKRPAPRIP